MIFYAFDLTPDSSRVFGGDARHKESFLVTSDARGNGRDLERGFAFAIDDFGEVLTQRPMQIHLSEPEVRYRRSLKRVQDFLHAGFTRAKPLEKVSSFFTRQRGEDATSGFVLNAKFRASTEVGLRRSESPPEG